MSHIESLEVFQMKKLDTYCVYNIYIYIYIKFLYFSVSELTGLNAAYIISDQVNNNRFQKKKTDFQLVDNMWLRKEPQGIQLY